jgi:hypothetical protein
VWHMRFSTVTAKWEFVGGSPLSYRQEGENNAYVAFANGTNITVNAAQNKLLAWAITPPVDVWLDATFHLGTVQKVDAAYHYAQFSTVWTGTPPIGSQGVSALRTQHQGVNQYEPYMVHGRWGLAAGVAYQVWVQAVIQGGSWTFNQYVNTLQLVGSAWPR